MKRTQPIDRVPEMRIPRIIDPAQRIGNSQDIAALAEEHEIEIALPRDHPVWRKDRLTASGRARRLLERIMPFVIRVFSFWDHATTKLGVDGRTVEIDASGSYRVD